MKEYLVKYEHMRNGNKGQLVVDAMNMADARVQFQLYVTKNNRDPQKVRMIVKIISVRRTGYSCSR